MYRPQKVKTYDPTNPEYGLVDMMVSEAFEAVSPEIYYWSLDTVTTKTSMDALDKVYGEKSSTSKITYKEPKLVHARIDFNPILKELSKLGTVTKEEVEISESGYQWIIHSFEQINENTTLLEAAFKCCVNFVEKYTNNTLKQQTK